MRKIKNILFMALFSLIISVQTISVSAKELSELQSGIYDIKNDVYHEVEIGMSMARTYLNEDMILEKSDGKWYYTITFTGTDYMDNHRLLINDKEVELQVIEENQEENSMKLKFETPSISPEISAQMYVDAMGRDVEFDIIPKEETLNLVEAIEEPKEEVKTEKTSDENVSNEKSSNKFIYIGIGLLVIITAILGFKKFKK